ncbi:MAG: class I SAM-dependent methyltransferase [Hyphomonadaceae bacterium]|nr:class I SAM-dependent methyltransferase [Hyphomonadaceae bacterium]
MNAHILQRDFARALEVAPYADDSMVGALTSSAVARGYSILQAHKLGPTDRLHAKVLLRYFDPPFFGRVLDAGCGVGAVAEHMSALRPDLKFVLLNVSAAQLALAPEGLEKIHADFHDIPAEDGEFDAAMFCYSLGHGLLDRCMAEAARVLRPGGALFIYDIAADDQARVIEALGYKPHHPAHVLDAAGRHGFIGSVIENLSSDVSGVIALCGREAYDAGFSGTRPVIYRFVR